MRRALATGFLLLLCAGFSRAAEPVRVAVSILPQAWFVERLGGDVVEAHVLVGPGESPASFDPTPRRMAELADARVLLRIGVPMENALLPHLTRILPDMPVRDMRRGMELTAIDGHHHAGCDHDHGETDPHVWLSPRLARTLAANTAEALIELLPARADRIRTRLAALDAELAALSAEIAGVLEPSQGRTMLVFHPSFGYFCADHGLRQSAIEQGGLAPSPRHLAAVLDDVARTGQRTVFVQPQFSEGSARSLAREAGLDVVVLDPLARDYATNLRTVAAAVAAGLAGVEEDSHGH